MDADIDRILWTESEISDRVSELAAEISADFEADSSDLVVVGVATGAFIFLADLVRKIRVLMVVDMVRVESYGDGVESNGEPRISSDLKVDVGGKHVIVVEDIVDTGHTLSCLISHLKSKGTSSISICTFLDKPARRRVHVQPVGKGKFYRGFECPDSFVVGYGMDFAELYRNLPYVGVLKPEKLDLLDAYVWIKPAPSLRHQPSPFPGMRSASDECECAEQQKCHSWHVVGFEFSCGS